MPLLTGTISAHDLRMGTTAVNAVYAGHTQVWTRMFPLVADTSATEIAAAGLYDAQTAPVIVTVSGGSGVYHYHWQRVSGDAAITALAPHSASTTFTAYSADTRLYTSLWRCQVTSGDQVAYSPHVTVHCSLISDW